MTIWVFDELYERGLTNRAIYQRIYGMGYAKERIRGDSAEPKSLDELREEGLRRIRPAGKGPDSIRSGIQYIQNFRIVVHVTPAPESYSVARTAGFITTESMAGKLRLRAKKAPTAAIKAQYRIINTVKN